MSLRDSNGLEDAQMSDSSSEPPDDIQNLAEFREAVLIERRLLDEDESSEQSSIPEFVYPGLTRNSESTTDAPKPAAVPVWLSHPLAVPSNTSDSESDLFEPTEPEDLNVPEGVKLEDIAPRRPTTGENAFKEVSDAMMNVSEDGGQVDDQPAGEAYSTPTDIIQRFKEYLRITEFTTNLGDTVKRDDCVYVSAHEGDWIGKVEDIREEQATYTVWVKIHWFYTKDHMIAEINRQMLTETSTSFDFKWFGANELIETLDHQEIYPSPLFERIAVVYNVVDAPGVDIRMLPPIPEGSWFCRTKYYLITPKKTNSPSHPRNMCLCIRDRRKMRPKQAGNSRFCPKSQCLRWFHEECLYRKKYMLPPPQETTGAALLAGTIPDDLDLSSLQVARDIRGVQPPEADSDSDSDMTSDSDSTLDCSNMEVPLRQSIAAAHLKPLLPDIAGLPIVRTPDQTYGNVRAICLARVLLRAVQARDQKFLKTISWETIEDGGLISNSTARRLSHVVGRGGYPGPLTVRSARWLSTSPNGSVPARETAEDDATAADTIIDPHYDLPQCGWDDQRVSVGWGDGMKWSRFHNIWLRDHCRCPECYHPVTKQRLLDTFEIPADVHPSSIEAKPEGLEITWPATPPHVSTYPWSWLRQNSYDPPLEPDTPVTSLSTSDPPAKILWGARIQESPPTVGYDDVMQDDMALLKWLKRIDQFGFCFIEGVPPTPEATEGLCRRIAFIRETQYGGFWDFTSDLKHGDTAYTNLALKAHTDGTYFTDPAGLQLFHLLSHTDGEGGHTLLVDGFYVASILKEVHPSAFDLLTQVRIQAHAAGEDASFYKPGPTSAGYPLITLDPKTHQVVQVRYNNSDRSVVNGLQGGQVEEWYEALRAWNKCLTSPDSEYWVKLTPGTAVVVDNHRVLHGRSAFTGKRRMCGAYIGADDYHSKLNVLEELARWRSSGAEARGEPRRSVWDPRL